MDQNSKVCVWQKVEEIRSQYPCLAEDQVPLDLIEFVELDLKIDLIPYDDLYRGFGADAALMADFSGIYVDTETYDLIDTAAEWKLNRLRFSLAHELGHFFLHQEVFRQQGIADENHLLDWLNSHNGGKYEIEQQANEFAGRLLVPNGRLQEHFDQLKSSLTAMHGSSHWVNDTNTRQKACELIAPKYGVHKDAISVRLDREEFWPSPY